MRKILYSFFFCISMCYSLTAAENDLLNGLDAYTHADWELAITSFERGLSSMPSEKKDILYWLVMAYISAHKYDAALSYADTFLFAYPADEYAAEVLYQKGRILHLYNEYSHSNNILYQFLQTAPDHPKAPSAYYWIGENFYAEQRFLPARELFSRIIIDYPESGKAAAAQKRIDEISMIAAHTYATGEFAETDIHTVSAMMPEEAAVNEKEYENEAVQHKIKTLEEKIEQLTEALAQLTKVQEKESTPESVLDEQSEIEKELAALNEKARILEELYEKRVKGEQHEE